jgi:prolyl-tRNA editing enzyme YbaK/EbsC (Cys-tRNA(Pro) deacylase)
MSKELSASARKVQETLQSRGFASEVVELPDSTRTAKEAAQAIGCRVEQIVKSLIFRTLESDRAILVVASGINRVDEQRLGKLVGETIGKADANFVREHTGFAVGGVPPIGHAEPITTFIDKDLLRYEQIWAAAGTPFAVFCLTPTELEEMTRGTVTSIK